MQEVVEAVSLVNVQLLNASVVLSNYNAINSFRPIVRVKIFNQIIKSSKGEKNEDTLTYGLTGVPGPL